MTTPNAAPEPALSGRLAGVRTVLQYSGIPVGWLNKRPKLPSRNWLIFLSVTSTVTGYYIYDRRECKRIRQHYIDLVKDQSEEPVRALETPRRITVYGSKWPGDDDYDQAMRYFRKYVKPILVAAAVDYDMVTGKRHGDIADRVANEIRLRRRLEAGIDEEPDTKKFLPTYKPPEQVRQAELEGGIVIVGRPTFKEFMAGLKRGWTEGLEKVDHDELLARECQNDGHFDEVDDEEVIGEDGDSSGQSKKGFSIPKTSPVFSPLQIPPVNSAFSPSTAETSFSTTDSAPPPATIPPVPPLLLVPFTDYLGFTQIPIMIWDWFNQRRKVQAGAEAAYSLIMKETRPIIPPAPEPETKFQDIANETPVDQGDLDFNKDAESWYKSSLFKIPAKVEKERKKYYEELPKKLATARELARGIREPTKDELAYPPPTEVELSAERIKKEKRWRRDVAGWELIKPDHKVEWDERFRDALRIFTSPSSSSSID